MRVKVSRAYTYYSGLNMKWILEGNYKKRFFRFSLSRVCCENWDKSVAQEALDLLCTEMPDINRRNIRFMHI